MSTLALQAQHGVSRVVWWQSTVSRSICPCASQLINKMIIINTKGTLMTTSSHQNLYSNFIKEMELCTNGLKCESKPSDFKSRGSSKVFVTIKFSLFPVKWKSNKKGISPKNTTTLEDIHLMWVIRRLKIFIVFRWTLLTGGLWILCPATYSQ